MKTLIYPRKSTNGTVVLYCRLVHLGRRETFTTNIRIEPKYWSHDRQSITGSTVELKKAKLELDRLRSRIQRECDKLLFEERFTLKRLKGVLLGKTEYNCISSLKGWTDFLKQFRRLKFRRLSQREERLPRR
ncbi:MAG: hypothetical protein J4F31_06730, partial [Flavobacteriales bacterium]|nr:hypothetical protein [Flavobacteriales bacterium]